MYMYVHTTQQITHRAVSLQFHHTSAGFAKAHLSMSRINDKVLFNVNVAPQMFSDVIAYNVILSEEGSLDSKQYVVITGITCFLVQDIH